jgi:HEAT repeat protein
VPWLRRATIERINGWIDIPGSSPILIRALSDSDSEVRKQAAEYFLRKKGYRSHSSMIALLADTATYHYKYYPYEYIREYAAKYLAEKGDQQAESPMMEALTMILQFMFK